jgi:hypothetical protein
VTAGDQRADEIRELFPAMIEIAQLKPAVEAATGPAESMAAHPSARPTLRCVRAEPALNGSFG